MASTKKVTITMTKETETMAQNDSEFVLGNQNVSGYISYLIKKNNTELKSQQ